MTEEEKLEVKGEVISVKPKYDRYNSNTVGVLVKPQGGSTVFWFRWSPSRGEIAKGDTIAFTGIKTGESEKSAKYGSVTVWMKNVKVVGKTCDHSILVRNGTAYSCEGCGQIVKVTIAKEAK